MRFPRIPLRSGSRSRLSIAAMTMPITLASGAAHANDALLELLRSKAILTEQEVLRLKGNPATAYDALLEVLRAKGVLDAAELAQLGRKGSAAAQAPAAESKRESASANAQATEVTVRYRDGVVFESAAQGFSLSLNGRVHADYRTYPNSRFNSGAVDTFEVRRARLGANATFGRYYEAEITGDFSSSAKLDTAYLNAEWWKAAQIRLGLFKMPFSLEEWTSSNYTDFQERSLANAQAPGKERGVMLHGVPRAGLAYALALSNGNGGGNTDDNEGKDVIGRLAANFAEWGSIKHSVLHLGVAASEGTRPVGDVVANGRTEARGVTFFDPVTFTGTRVDLGRRGLETALAFGPVKFQAEAINTRYEGASAAAIRYDRDQKAHYASLSWLVTGERYADSYKNGAFGRIHPKANFGARGGLGAIELALRHSRLNAEDFSSSNPAGTGALGNGLANRASAWTLGLKWIVNPNVRFLLNVVDTRFGAPVTVGSVTAERERAVTVRGQLNF